MPPRDETRLQPPPDTAPISRGEVAPSAAGEPPLLAAIRARHGHGPLADLLYKAELEHRQALAERGRQLKARISVLQETLDRRRQEGEAALEPLHLAMEASRAAWQKATEAYDRRRIANQSELMPLANELEQAIRELSRSGFDDRVNQWSVPDWYAPMPEHPPLGIGPTGRPRGG